jgi:hypothetical protein
LDALHFTEQFSIHQQAVYQPHRGKHAAPVEKKKTRSLEDPEQIPVPIMEAVQRRHGKGGSLSNSLFISGV